MLALVGARAGKLRESKAKERTKAELRKGEYRWESVR